MYYHLESSSDEAPEQIKKSGPTLDKMIAHLDKVKHDKVYQVLKEFLDDAEDVL